MTITSQTTRQGKVIHLLSPGDLGDAVESGGGGGRLRAYCPVHGGDHQRSLSIDPETGWGFCHCCHATVLVTPTGSGLVGGRAYAHAQRHASSNILTFPPRADHRSSPPARPSLVQHTHRATTASGWQQEEVAALATITPLICQALTSSRRVWLYLSERGIPPTLAHASNVGYLSRAVWEQAPTEWRSLLTRWIGRIIFPLGSPKGQGFIGRTLLRWEPGMDENAHKALLDQPGSPRRWIKTNPAGWFGLNTPELLTQWVVLVEGGFDRLALLAAGFPATSVLALVGTAARPAWLARSAPQVKGVVLGLDADEGGQTAMERLAGESRLPELAVVLCLLPHDRWGKDWSERWRRLGPQSLWPLYEAFVQHQAALGERT
jgi:Toprim-like